MEYQAKRYEGAILRDEFNSLIKNLDMMMHKEGCQSLDECYHQCTCYQNDITYLDTALTTSCQKILRFILDQLENGLHPERMAFNLQAYEIACHEFHMTFIQQNAANFIIGLPIIYTKHEKLCYDCAQLLRKQYYLLKEKGLLE